MLRNLIETIFRDPRRESDGGVPLTRTVLLSFVDKILTGAKLANLRVEQPTTFELVINMKLRGH